MACTQDSTCFSWDELPDDSKWVYEALAQLGYCDFSVLAIADQSLVLALAIHLKRTSQCTAQVYEA